MQGAYMPIAERVQTDETALDGKEIQVGDPLLAEENLRRVHIVVECHAEEKHHDCYVQLVVPFCTVVVHDEKLTIVVINNVLKMHGWPSICVCFFLLPRCSTNLVIHRPMKIVFALLNAFIQLLHLLLSSVHCPNRSGTALGEHERLRDSDTFWPAASVVDLQTFAQHY